MTRSISYLHKAAIALALIATVFISTELASAQSAGGPNVLNMGQVSGTILEAGSGDALFSATVAVWSLPDSVLVTGATTDMKGSFEIDRLDPGQYIIKVSFVGFQTWTTQSFTISESNRVINLGTVSLAFDSEQMGGVEVTAERADVAFEIDRTVYNTKSQISSAGGNA
ncbi:MAG: TonB-dependent receptor, partial [Bacteroidetes Order II. Incertae sedis bacterium]|nr:TonB-dependent receptor [Bacteroidetes Order II. bacterium]